LSQGRSKFIDAHWFLHELLNRIESGWVCQVGEETIADFSVSFLHSCYTSPFLINEIMFI